MAYRRLSIVHALLAALLLTAADGAAQTTAQPVLLQEDTSSVRRGVTVTLTDADALRLTATRATTAATQQTERRRRRPSMVGYVGDAGIQSQVRLRMDAGTGVDAADRAEFFYPKCGCYRFLPANHPAFDPNAPGPGPGINTDLNFQQLYVQAEYAFSDRFSLYGELPVRWIQPQAFVPGTGSFENQSGLSDIRAGAKVALVATDTAYLTLQLQGQFASGDGLRGLGNERFGFEPALLYNQALGERVTFESQFGAVLPSGGSDGIATGAESFAGRVLYYGFGPSVEIYSGDTLRFAPVVELVGWHVLNGFQTSTFSEADGVNIVNLKLGGRFLFQDRSSVYVGFGRGLTDEVWYKNLFRVEYRYTF